MDGIARIRQLLAGGVDLCVIEDILDVEFPLELREQPDDTPEQVTAPAA